MFGFGMERQGADNCYPVGRFRWIKSMQNESSERGFMEILEEIAHFYFLAMHAII
jgi:hypothetical protein